MKLFTALCASVLLYASAASAQWSFVKNFPNDTFIGPNACHGIAVDPDGKVWIQIFGVTDSVVVSPGTPKKATRVIYVFNPDGTPAAFSPIKLIKRGGVITDSMSTPPDLSNRGLRADHNGNILVCSFDRLFRLDYKTGESLNDKIIPRPGQSLAAPGVDAQGNIFTAHVNQNAHPIQIFDKDFNLLGVAVDTSRGFSRSFEVSKDGNTIYWAGYTRHAIYKYSRPDEFSAFALTDTILKGFDSESFGWNPKTGRLWLSAGSYNDLPNRFPGAVTSWSPNTWYAYNPTTNQVEDSLKWNFNTPANAAERPRAIAFSVGGDTAYVGCFGGTYPAVQMLVRKPVSVAERPTNIPEGYALSQNFPNPFNPSTEIQFSIAKAGVTTLKIYDMLGKEVATLVDKHLPVGTHKFTFDASRLATGAYIYEMTSNGVRLSKKMSFMK